MLYNYIIIIRYVIFYPVKYGSHSCSIKISTTVQPIAYMYVCLYIPHKIIMFVFVLCAILAILLVVL